MIKAVRFAGVLATLIGWTVATQVAHAETAADVWRPAGPGGGYIGVLRLSPGGVLYAGTGDNGVFQSTDGGLTWGISNGGLPAHASVRALAIDPTDADTMYVGTSGAGVFKSEDAGRHWVPINAGLLSQEVTTLAIDPLQRNVLYVGTIDAGLFASSNAGARWISVDLDTEVKEVTWVTVGETAAYAATQGAGIWKLEAGGERWRALKMSPRYINVIAIDPRDPAIVYGAGFGASKSTDGGRTWSAINGGIEGNGYPPQLISFLIDPRDPTTLWAGTWSGVVRSRDAGATWSRVGSADPNGYSDVSALTIAIDSRGEDTVYVGSYGLIASTNEGRTWQPTGLPGATSTRMVLIDPTQPQVLYAVTNGDVFKSFDGAAHWRRSNRGLPGAVMGVAIDPVETKTLYAATDGGVFKSDDGADTWTATTLTGRAIAIALSPGNPSTIFVSAYHPEIGNDIYVSDDAGATWQRAEIYIGSLGGFIVDPGDPMTVYSSGWPYAHSPSSGGIIRSSDLGAHWALTGLRSFDSVNPLAVDPLSSSVLYASYRAGLLKSQDGGVTWRAMNAGLLDGAVAQMAFDPLDPSIMYAAGGPVSVSTDGAASWTPLGRGLDDSAIALAVDPVDGKTIYAGTTDHGVYVLYRTDLDPLRSPPDILHCNPNQIDVSPSVVSPGTTVVLTGACYFLHSGRRAPVYFDATPVGEVIGDTPGNYSLEFVIPTDAIPGIHAVRVGSVQTTTVEVQPSENAPTATPTHIGSYVVCSSDNLTVVPNNGPAGTRIAVSGQCYYIHSGRGDTIYFDDTPLGEVRGDTPGGYEATFVVPADAALGTHTVRLRTYQSATFTVDDTGAPLATPTVTIRGTGTSTPQPTATATGTAQPPSDSTTDDGDSGGCSISPSARHSGSRMLLLIFPGVLVALRCRKGFGALSADDADGRRFRNAKI